MQSHPSRMNIISHKDYISKNIQVVKKIVKEPSRKLYGARAQARAVGTLIYTKQVFRPFGTRNRTPLYESATSLTFPPCAETYFRPWLSNPLLSHKVLVISTGVRIRLYFTRHRISISTIFLIGQQMLAKKEDSYCIPAHQSDYCGMYKETNEKLRGAVHHLHFIRIWKFVGFNLKYRKNLSFQTRQHFQNLHCI